jgi:hypothetical protein
VGRLDAELFEVFPFGHELRYEACLASGRLELGLTVHANGTDAVPLVFGFPPYICLPGARREQWLVELPAMRRLALDDNQIPVAPDETWEAQRFELGERELDAFDEVEVGSRFAVIGARRRNEIEFVEGYPCAQVFAPRDVECICFESMAAAFSGSRLKVTRTRAWLPACLTAFWMASSEQQKTAHVTVAVDLPAMFGPVSALSWAIRSTSPGCSARASRRWSRAGDVRSSTTSPTRPSCATSSRPTTPSRSPCTAAWPMTPGCAKTRTTCGRRTCRCDAR